MDVEDVTYIGFDAETSGQHVARWPAGLEYVRPAVIATSLGPPRPVRRLLACPEPLAGCPAVARETPGATGTTSPSSAFPGPRTLGVSGRRTERLARGVWSRPVEVRLP